MSGIVGAAALVPAQSQSTDAKKLFMYFASSVLALPTAVCTSSHAHTPTSGSAIRNRPALNSSSDRLFCVRK